MHRLHIVLYSLIYLLCIFAVVPACADTAAAVARLSYTSGPVSFSPAGEKEWVLPSINRPLITGDRLWADAAGRAELQLDGAVVRIGDTSYLNIVNLNTKIVQLELSKGVLNLVVQNLAPDQVYEIDTPLLAFVVTQVGDYRVDINSAGDEVVITMHNGGGVAYSADNSYEIDFNGSYVFNSSNFSDVQFSTRAPDDFDSWATYRNQQAESSLSAQYVSNRVIGYQDLDSYGEWKLTDEYDYAWFPSGVSSDWVPFRLGHWIWLDSWGWTWVDDEPWGFAPSHYGRWANINGKWAWIPGPREQIPRYVPAMVAFISETEVPVTFGYNEAATGWFPLAPGEVYWPEYDTSSDYFVAVNESNTTLQENELGAIYNNPPTEISNYRNIKYPHAVTMVPNSTFINSHEIAHVAVPVEKDLISNAKIMHHAPITPSAKSILGKGHNAHNKPPAAVLSHPSVLKTPPPASVTIPYEAKQFQTPGQPLKEENYKTVTPAEHKYRIISPVQPAAVIRSRAPMSLHPSQTPAPIPDRYNHQRNILSPREHH